MAQTDGQLITAVRTGSKEAAATLVRRHWGRCHRVAFLITADVGAAEGVAQEAILSALQALDRFDVSRPLEPWLHRIVVSEARDWLRKRAREPELIADADAAHVGVAELELPPAPPDEILDHVRRLRPSYRIIIAMRYVLDYTPAEIAEVLEIPPATVRTRLRRALIELRHAIDRKEKNDAIAT
jgi:RNA polymerase sigma-70 factor (ECF subfamily)